MNPPRAIVRPSEPRGAHHGPPPGSVHRRNQHAVGAALHVPGTRQGSGKARWPLARLPHLLETSLPGVFAAGDMRGGSIQRVASAVGEGSIAITFVHQAPHE
jgi:NADPH-dependent glutamate synthase beta subunit-like oxidoreductase